MPRPRRFPRKTSLVLGVLAVLLSVPQAGHAAAAVPGHPASARAVPAQAVPAQAVPAQAMPAQAVSVSELSVQAVSGRPASGQPVTARTLAATAPAGSSGLCSVPGIGDVGGLLGFCALGSSGLTGDLNSVCEPSVPDPEPASSGIDSLVKPPATGKPALATPYNQYGVAGQYWAATDLKCSDMTSLIGNSVAGMLFDVAKSIDRVTITVYQAAAGEGILAWLRNAADRLISGLGNAIYFPYVAIVVIIGAIWLAWQGLIRKRGTRTIEGTVWMVVACAAAIWLIGRPADFTGIGKGVSDGISTTLNTAFAKLPNPGQNACMPVRKGDPQIQPASYSYTSGNTVVDQNANELWTVLVCKPWLDGELGTTNFAKPGGTPTPVNTFARQLLWSQAIAVNEKPTTALIQAKQATYTGIAQSIKQQDPGIYPLFQGKEWTTRLELAFAALLAAVVAGILVLLISVTLILLKLGFLLLLIVGPFFLLIGTHPGFGRVVAVRWFEMLVGVLLKQAAVALVLSVLLYCYALIMGTSDAVLPWALKILMIALVTVAVFIYRRPFQHLFSAVGYGVIGSTERAEIDLRRAGSTLRSNTVGAATVAVPGFAAYRAARWARRNPGQAAGLAMGATGAGGAVAAGAARTDGTASIDGTDGYSGTDAGGLAGPNGTAGGNAAVASGAGGSDGTRAGGRAGLGSRVRALGASAGNGADRDAPPLNLPSRAAPQVPAQAGWTRGGDATQAGRVPPGRAAPDASAVPAAAAQAPGAAPRAAGPAPRAAGPAGSAPPRQPAAAARNPAAWPSAGAAPVGRDAGGSRSAGAGPWSGQPREAGAARGRLDGAAPAAAGPFAPRPSAPPVPPAGPGPVRQSGPVPAGPGPVRQPGPAPAGPFAPRSPAPPPAAPAGSGPVRQPGPVPAGPGPVRQSGSAPARQSGPFAPRSAPPARPAESAPARPAGPWPAGQGWSPSAGHRETQAGAGAEGGRSSGPDGEPVTGAAGDERSGSAVPFWLRPIRRRK